MQMLRAPRTYIMVVRDDGNYIFAHGYGGDFSRMHRQLLWGLLIIMIGVVLTAYLVMKRALIPLRLLNIGVAQLSEGQLDVVVPKKSDDEFGVLTEAFNRMALRVGNMIQARDQLLLDVSHELRSPLTRLRVALELMPDSARRQTMVTDLNEMETMVTELLELHRLKSGVSRPSTQVNLVAIVSEVVERYEGQPPGVSIKAQQPELMVAAEAARVRTIVRNLLENALKFSLPDSGPIEINLTRSESSVVLRLTDDGVGVPDGDLERLFEPFYRLDKSRSRRTGGYGLGLSMCKRLMEAHGGKIALTRNETRGLTVVLEFSTSQV